MTIQIGTNNVITAETNNNTSNEIITKNKQIKQRGQSHPKDEIKFQTNFDSKDNEDEEEQFDLNNRGEKRNNSLLLYKKNKKDKFKKNGRIRISKKDLKHEDIYNVIEDGTSLSNKGVTKARKKKVAFLPNFVTIIDVESYKKYNEENTKE